MLPIATDRCFDAARATNRRRRVEPIYRPAILVSELGDPRTPCFDAREQPFRILRHLPALFCLAIVIGCAWAAGLAVTG